MPKRNTYHLFWAKQTQEETPEEFWRRLIEIKKECNFITISAEELLISKYMTAITVKKLRDKIMKKNTGIEEGIEERMNSLNRTHMRRKTKRTQYRKL